MSAHGPRLEFAVGAFLLLSLASLLVLAIASTNGRFGFGEDTYDLKARFTNLGQLRPMAPVKIGGVPIGKVASIELDPKKLDAVVTLNIDSRYRDLSIDTSASILTGGLLGESYVGLQPGGDMEVLKPGEEIAFTTPAVDLIQMAGKYIFGGTGTSPDSGTKPDAGDSNASSDASPTGQTPDPMTIKTSLTTALLGAALLAAASVSAQQTAPARATPASATMQGTPSQLVLNNSQRVLTTLEKRRAEFSKNRVALRQFISTEFNAMFDRDYAARQVLGRHGRGASDEDVKLFADALADNLMQRYGSSLLDFNTQLRVRVKSETPLPRGLGVKVSSEFLRQGGAAIPVDYLMRKTGAQWKVFDVMVEGVSYVQTFRNQFDAELQRKTIKQVATELRNGQIKADAGE